MPMNCPGCGSDRVTKFTLFQEKKSGGGCGCIGCLLLIIVFLLAPVLVLVVGVLFGAAVYALKVPLIIAAVVGICLSIAVKIHQSKLWVCESCGHRFAP